MFAGRPDLSCLLSATSAGRPVFSPEDVKDGAEESGLRKHARPAGLKLACLSGRFLC
jgi:hypothetical protein